MTRAGTTQRQSTAPPALLVDNTQGRALQPQAVAREIALVLGERLAQRLAQMKRSAA